LSLLRLAYHPPGLEEASSASFHPYETISSSKSLDPAFFLDSWIVVILSILEVISSVGVPFCLKLLFQGP